MSVIVKIKVSIMSKKSNRLLQIFSPKQWYAIGSALILIIIVIGLSFVFLKPATIPEYRNYGAPGSFSLLDQYGKNVTLNNYTGKVLLIDFIYTHCPDVCPLESSNMNALLLKLINNKYNADQFHFISISFDYRYENQTTLQAFEKVHINNMSQELNYWSFLYGSFADFNKTYPYHGTNKNVTSEYGVYVQYNNTITSSNFSPLNAPNNIVDYIEHNLVLTLVDAKGITQQIYIGGINQGPQGNFDEVYNAVTYLINHPNFTN